MTPSDRVRRTGWPTDPNVGGVHLTVRYLAAPLLLALGGILLAGWWPAVTGTAAVALGAAALVAGVVSLIEARTRKCPGYAWLGIDTCPRPETDDGAAEEAA